MSLEVTAWNVLDAYSDEASARELIALMDEQQPDVAVFPEAYAEDKQQWLDLVQEDYESAGYRVTHGLYDDADSRADRHGLLVISREDLTDTDADLVRLAGRNAIALTLHDRVTDTGIHFVGLHLDDRQESTRLAQTTSLLEQVSEKQPLIAAGDFNAMHRHGAITAVLRAVKPAVELLPAADPDPNFTPSKLSRVGSIATRLSEMATGTTMAKLEEAGFVDADPQHRPTMSAKYPLFQLDHIMTKGELTVVRHSVQPYSHLSDHRAVSATFKAA